jgi:WD40 repeat protein
MFALIIAALASPEWMPLERPGLLARIGSPAFRCEGNGRLQAVSRDGTRIYTVLLWGCSNGSSITAIGVWDAKTGVRLKSYDPEETGGYIRHYRFAADGLRVVATERDSRRLIFRLLNPDTGKLIREGKSWEPPPKFREKGLGYNGVTELEADQWMVYPAEKEKVLLDIETGKVVSFTPAVSSESGWIRPAPDGRTALVGAGDGQLRLFDLPGAKLRAEWQERKTHLAADFTPDGKSLCVWEKRETGWALELWSVAGLDRRPVLEKRRQPGYVRFAPNGKTFALADRAAEGTPFSVGVYEAATGKRLLELPRWVNKSEIEFGPDGRTLWTAASGTLVPWDVFAGKPAPNAPYPLAPITRFRFLNDGQLVGLSGGRVITWNPTTGNETTRVETPVPFESWDGWDDLTPMLTQSGDRLVYPNATGRLISWNWRTGEKTRPFSELRGTPETPEEVFTSDMRFLIGRRENKFVVRDAASGKKLIEHPLPDVAGLRDLFDTGRASFDVSADGKRFAMISRDSSEPVPFAVLDLADPKPAFVTGKPDHAPGPLALSPDGRFVAIVGDASAFLGADRSPLTIWDATTGRKIGVMSLPATDPVAIGFSPDRAALAIAFDRKVVLVETKTWKVAAVVRGRTQSSFLDLRDVLAWSPSGKRLAVSTGDDRVIVWDVYQLMGK